MSLDTLFFLFGFAVIAGVSMVPAVQQELAERRHARRVSARHGRRSGPDGEAQLPCPDGG